jgi:general secretion pathway protein G
MNRSRFKTHPGRKQRGFTLLEMLAVIVLLGIVATIVVRQVGGNVDKGKYGAGKAQLASLGMKIESYALDVGSPPKALQQLVEKGNTAGWAGPYAKPSDLKDPFGHAFGYRFPGQHGSFDLIFYGQDGQAGGEGYSADLGNWE